MAADTAAAIGLTYRLLAQAGTVRPNLPERFRISGSRSAFDATVEGLSDGLISDACGRSALPPPLCTL
jgi:hypothetical protein